MNQTGQIIVLSILIIFATLYSSCAGYFFSKQMIRWIKIKPNCYFRAFLYGVLGGIATIKLRPATGVAYQTYAAGL